MPPIQIAKTEKGLVLIPSRLTYGVYAMMLGVCASIWLRAIRAPLWTDETLSYYVIERGFGGIHTRQGWPGLPAPGYYYPLWLWSAIVGTGEVWLRILSVLAMLAAVYFLFRAAGELFGWEGAFLVAVVFCVHPIVIFASIDVRPYAFAALAISLAIFLLVRLRESNSRLLAACFGVTAASIVYFQLLYAAILFPLAVSFLVVKARYGKKLGEQAMFALAFFALGFLPIVPALLYMFQTRGSHVFDNAPRVLDFAWTLAPGQWSYFFAGALLVAAVSRGLDFSKPWFGWVFGLCAALAFLPLLILFGVSRLTPLHVFVFRYRMMAIAGIALFWGWILIRICSPLLRLVLCLALVFTTAFQYYTSPMFATHEHSWKHALKIAERSASPDQAPVLICSDLVESNQSAMPEGAAVKESALFPQLSYYKLTVPVVALPSALNQEAIGIGMNFVREAASHRQRFLALGYAPSYDTLHWLISVASATHDVRILAQGEQTTGIVVLEFTPRGASL